MNAVIRYRNGVEVDLSSITICGDKPHARGVLFPPILGAILQIESRACIPKRVSEPNLVNLSLETKTATNSQILQYDFSQLQRYDTV